MYIGFRKGATAYEFQIGRLYGRFVHLMGGGWKWYTLLGRMSLGWEAKEE